MDEADRRARVVAATQAVADHYDADILGYVGFLFEPYDQVIQDICRSRSKRKNVLLILSTPGGSADAAFRIARCLQRSYLIRHDNVADRGHFMIYVHDICTSAGTILALGATRLIMSQKAQLGPIDVQLRRDDEVGERRSGLTSRQALETLASEAGRTFQRLFRYMRFDQRLQLSTKMAADLAARMAIGMMEPVYAQLDPMRLGEVERFVRISQEYGERLKTPNVRKNTIERLLGAYPSHEFVIDREEASDLFERVEKPIDALELIAEVFIRENHPSDENDDSFIAYLSEEVAEEVIKDDNVSDEQSVDREAFTSEGPDDGEIRSSDEGGKTRVSTKRGNGRMDKASLVRKSENGAKTV